MSLRFDEPQVGVNGSSTPERPSPEPVRPLYRQMEYGKVPARVVVLLSAVLVAGSIGDFVNAKTVFDLVFSHSSAYIGWLLAVSITVGAVIATHAAGYLCREGRHRRGMWWISAPLLLAWAATGASLGVARAEVSDSGPSAAHSGPFSSLTSGSGPHPVAIPVLLGCVWAVTGLVSFAVGYLVHHPASAGLQRLETAARDTDDELIVAVKNETAAGHTLDSHRGYQALLPEAERQAEAAADAHRDQLFAHARLELIRLLGDPAATNDILPRPNNNDEEEQL